MTPRKLHHAIALALLLGWPAFASAQVSVSVNIAPPELPVYDQPPIPGDGYLWTPGYWAWSDDEQGYYWVPGTWVEAPQPGYLWTPGYWDFSDGFYVWNAGYWGPHVGFYGGVNYGYGYSGRGYEGGYWQNDRLFYNRSVVNMGTTRITNVYNRTVVNDVTVNRVSYHGGNGGARAAATPAEQQAARDRHVAETGEQRQHLEAARQYPALRAAENHGRPPVAATALPGRFTGSIAAARGAAAMTGGDRNVPPAGPGREQRPVGDATHVPESRDNGTQSTRRSMDRDQYGPAAAAPPRSIPRAQPPFQQEQRPQQEMHAAPEAAQRERPEPQRGAPQGYARPLPPVERQQHEPRPPQEMRMSPPPAVQPPRPAEAPQNYARPPAEAPQPQMHTQAPPRPSPPEPRPQAQPPHPPERPPEHH